MRQPVRRLSPLTFVVLLLVGCGTTIQPRAGTGGTDRPSEFPPEDDLGPRPSPVFAGAPAARSLLDQICRTQPMPSGWIAIRYMAGGEKCPASTDPEDPYNVAIIERHRQRPVGATMVVCADQPVPRNWVREWNREPSAECPGARVEEDTPTTFAMRRVR